MTNELQHARVHAAAKSLALYEWTSWDLVPQAEKMLYIEQARDLLATADAYLPSVEQIAEVLHAELVDRIDPEYGLFSDADLHAARAVRALFGAVTS